MKVIEYIKSLFRPSKYISKYDEELNFSISIGENCEVCYEQLDYYKNVGYKGEPTKCENCEKQLNRESKLKEIGI
jgi:hypothetical protein